MSALRALTVSEARLFLREPASVFFALAFPTVLLLGIGLVIPGMRDVITDPGVAAGLRPIDIYLPVVLALAIATTAITILPPTFAIYREKGVLRRLSTTPMPASRLLVADILVNAVALVAGVVIALVTAVVVFDIAAPTQPALVAGVFLLGAIQMMALGCLIAAVVPNAGSASAVSMSMYFPMLFFAGVWTPGPIMSDTLARIATYVPLGSVAQGLTEGWIGAGVPWLQIGVMTAWTVVLVPLATRLFRWS